MSLKFTKKTFEYFDQAKENRNRKEWFKENEKLYLDHVKGPFKFMIDAMNMQLGDQLDILTEETSQSICRPLRPKNRAIEKGYVKDFISIDIAQKRSSLFEWNPGIHIQLGSSTDDNFIGGGLYLVSGRQIKKLRTAFYEDYQTINKLISNTKFKKVWSEMKGEKYKRFPKGFNPEDEAAKFLWFKQFYFSKLPARSKVVRSDFIGNVIEDIEAGIPITKWIIDAVGNYQKP